MPELLDTLAIVQMKLGQFTSAKETLSEAMRKSTNVGLRMRMAEVLLAMGDEKGAKEFWQTIDRTKLDKLVLVPADKRTLDRLKATLDN